MIEIMEEVQKYYPMAKGQLNANVTMEEFIQTGLFSGD